MLRVGTVTSANFTQKGNVMTSTKPIRKRYSIIDSLPKLKKLAVEMSKLEEFAFDTETNTLKVNGENSEFKIVDITMSWGEYNNYDIPLGHIRTEDIGRQLYIDTVVKYLKPIFEDSSKRIIGHNLKYDMHVLSRIGIHIKTEDLYDTMIMSWLCNENTPNGLKDVTKEKFKVDQTHFNDALESVTKEIKKEYGLKASNKATFDLTLIDDGCSYAIDDAFYTFQLYEVFLDLMEKENMAEIYEKVYKKFLRVLYTMEEQGVTIDRNHLGDMIKESSEDLENLKYKMFELAGVEFEPTSNQQLAELLFGYQKLDREGNISKNINDNIIKMSFGFSPISYTKGGAPQTNLYCITKISQKDFKSKRKKEGVELCNCLLEYKKLAKLKTAFMDGLDVQIYDDNKVHCSFNIIGTDSGRISCQNPNLQQLPKAEDNDKYQIRSLFIGSIDEETGKRKKIISSDFSNLEMRVLAHFSEDKKLLDMFANNDDAHGSTAVNMFELDCKPTEVKKKYPHLRQAAKVINFMLMYGGGAYTLYQNLKDDPYSPIDLGSKNYLEEYHVRKGEEVAQIYIDKYFKTYAGVSEFIRNQKRYAHKHGYVYTLLRRKRRLPDINSSDFGMQSYSERLSVNSCIQGSAADITMSAQNRIAGDSWFKKHRVNMLIQVHDELVFECPEEYVEECIKKIQHYMSHPFGDNVELNLSMDSEADFGDSYQEAK
jgi:DNA polymerase-1